MATVTKSHNSFEQHDWAYTSGWERVPRKSTLPLSLDSNADTIKSTGETTEGIFDMNLSFLPNYTLETLYLMKVATTKV
jgi:hypothetical protein